MALQAVSGLFPLGGRDFALVRARIGKFIEPGIEDGTRHAFALADFLARGVELFPLARDAERPRLGGLSPSPGPAGHEATRRHALRYISLDSSAG
ncbi:MAG: hypothetical protein JF588_21175 [Caulobacterales bacterium]|nr:hypothetical protein [Caulobacterales bacterium]